MDYTEPGAMIWYRSQNMPKHGGRGWVEWKFWYLEQGNVKTDETDKS